MNLRTQRKPQPKQYHIPYIALLCFYVIGIGTYFALRFGGNWMEVDTARLTRISQAVLNEATAIPSDAYPHGFTYPVVVAWIAELSGVSVLELQTLFLPIIGMLLPALVAFAFFRVVLGKGNLALLAVVLLCLQGDFLFVTLRSSHEKLTWSLMMLALFLIYRSVSPWRTSRSFAIHVFSFYLIIFTQITINSFFASTFMTAMTLSFVIGMMIHHWQKHDNQSTDFLKRLALISASAIIFLHLFLFYLYSPAKQIFALLPDIYDKMATLLLGFELQSNPYTYIGLTWISTEIYLAISLFTWLLLLTSLLEWFRQAYHLLRGKQSLRLPDSLPWLLYAGFAIQIAIAITMDFAGALSANLQLRILPGLTVFAVILVTQALQRLLASIRWTATRRRLLLAGAQLLIIWFVPASLVKITNEPIFSNKWFFYNAPEKVGFEWSDAHTQPKYEYMWVGLDERLAVMFVADHLRTEKYYETGTPEPTTRYFLLSQSEMLRHYRVGAPLPDVKPENNVYDNGEVQLYHKRARTPYQR